MKWKMIGNLKRVTAPLIAASAVLLIGPTSGVFAQGRGGPPPTPKAISPEDLTGYWVSIVSEDWRFRMVTPPKGDYMSVPINPEGRKVADAWDPDKDIASGNACKSYGAAALMRVPGRIHITWQDDNTLKVETDAGTQTRIFHFNANAPEGTNPSLQGWSDATWDMPPPGRGGRGAPPPPPPPAVNGAQNQRAGSLKVVTTHLSDGYLRKNGVPYSANTVLTEYYSRTNEPNGDSLLFITTIVEDPKYLQQPFITSTNFKLEPNGSKWMPTQCEAK